MSCETVQAALDEGAPDASELRAHLAECADCAAHEDFLRSLDLAIARDTAPVLAPALLARTRTRAMRALRAHAQAPARGFLLELAAVLAVLTLGLPFVLAHAWLVAEGALALLGGIVPPLLLEGLGVLYFGSLALTIGTLYALLPLWVAAVRRARVARVRPLEHGA